MPRRASVNVGFALRVKTATATAFSPNLSINTAVVYCSMDSTTSVRCRIPGWKRSDQKGTSTHNIKQNLGTRMIDMHGNECPHKRKRLSNLNRTWCILLLF